MSPKPPEQTDPRPLMITEVANGFTVNRYDMHGHRPHDLNVFNTIEAAMDFVKTEFARVPSFHRVKETK